MIKEASSRDDVLQALPGVDEEFLPTVDAFNTWRVWVRWSEEADEDGWFLGWCPLHDRERQQSDYSTGIGAAGYNFFQGGFWCGHDPSCHEGRRGMTLVNLLKECARRYLDG